MDLPRLDAPKDSLLHSKQSSGGALRQRYFGYFMLDPFRGKAGSKATPSCLPCTPSPNNQCGDDSQRLAIVADDKLLAERKGNCAEGYCERGQKQDRYWCESSQQAPAPKPSTLDAKLHMP